MKKILLVLTSLLAVASLGAQTSAPAAPSSSVTADLTYTSKYVFRGVLLAKGAFQPSVKFTSGDYYTGIWGSLPVDRGYELEFDYTVGYGGWKLSDNWTLDVGLTAYTYPGLNTSGGADKATFEGFVGANGAFGDFTTGTYAYYDATLKVFTLQEAAGYTLKLGGKATLNLLATVGHAIPDAGSSYTYYGFGATVPCKLTDKATLTLGVQYADHDISGLTGNHFWGTVGLTYAF